MTRDRKWIGPDKVSGLLDVKKKSLFVSFNGKLNEKKFAEILMEIDSGGVLPKTKRYCYEEDQFFYIDSKTCAMTNQGAEKQLK